MTTKSDTAGFHTDFKGQSQGMGAFSNSQVGGCCLQANFEAEPAAIAFTSQGQVRGT
jgi:hypothetical protein